MDEFAVTAEQVKFMTTLMENDKNLSYGEKYVATLLLLVLTGQGFTHDAIRLRLMDLKDQARG